MKLYSTYRCKIKHYNHILKETIVRYRSAVDFCIQVCLEHWEQIKQIKTPHQKQQYVERLIHSTQNNAAIYDFDVVFYKFPSYLRRTGITEAIGKVSSYYSNLENWKKTEHSARGNKPGLPKAGFIYPCMYRDNMYQKTDGCTARIKVWVNHTWDWIDVTLRKSDVDYINRYCRNRKSCAPTLMKRGKQWYLDFPFEE